MGIVGRADLLRALAAQEAASRAAVASVLGFVPDPTFQERPDTGTTKTTLAGGTTDDIGPAPGVTFAETAGRPVPFWRPERFAIRPRTEQLPIAAPPIWRGRPAAGPPHRPLAPWRALAPTLRRLLTTDHPTSEIDVDRVVAALSRGQRLERPPAEERPRWPQDLVIILDRSDRLIPYWDDQVILARALGRFLAHARVTVTRIDETMVEPASAGPGAAAWPPAPGASVLVLGDLGCLDPDSTRLTARWHALGDRLAQDSVRLAALVPAPLSRCSTHVRVRWNALSWDIGAPELPQDSSSRRVRADRLLGFLTSSVRVEPAMLRELRHSLPRPWADAGTEADVWGHPAIANGHVAGASLAREIAAPLSQVLIEADVEIQRAVLAARARCRATAPDEIWFLEVLGLPPVVHSALLNSSDVDAARSFCRSLHEAPATVTRDPARVDAWLEEARAHVAAPAWAVAEFAMVAGDAARRSGRSDDLPGEIDPIHLPPTGPERLLALHQRGAEVVVTAAAEPSAGGTSSLCLIRSTNDVVVIGPGESLDDPGDVARPSWANDFGRDEFGLWASIIVSAHGVTATQRLRWILPGQFLMGSRDDEWGRYSDEGPRHEVTIAEGFWLFDTPCTQALWDAVMAGTPSQFQGSDRPVERVSFEDVGQFLERINAVFPGLELELPSEARWEYAARAGTATATHGGDLAEDEATQRRVLDPIAWWSGNSGGETRPVGQTKPNDWGLYDMLGNVREWCADHWHDDYDGPPTDGSAWIDDMGAALRVFRGGSWDDDARGVRAAYRLGLDPGLRGDDLGFRCSRVQGGEATGEARPAGASADRASRAEAEPGRPRGPAHVPVALRVAGTDAAFLPAAPSILVRTDREKVVLRRIDRRDPDLAWASGLGRDRHGLFADFTLPERDVTQRMRWIPPGRFLMGSPGEEAGRWEDEGPRHEVTIAEGFWLFDTPCTQALWEAVLGDNPSTFRSPDRPVEGVSFDDVGRFLERINHLVPGLDLALPSEARWEYACRAGTETATWAGDLDILGENNAPILDAIAWYGGNSGMGFELDNGFDSAGWKEKQHEHSRAGTHPVGRRKPNPWGLHDMLGNVWEWCADDWHASYDGAPTDGSDWIGRDRAALRVIRGGSWGFDARFVRAACRSRFVPGARDDDLGFRCSRVQVSGATSGWRSAAGGGVGGPGEASRGGARPTARADARPRPPRGGMDAMIEGADAKESPKKPSWWRRLLSGGREDSRR